MKLKWLGHACFVAESEGYSIAIDPYGDGAVPGLRPLLIEANEVLSSHNHHDHDAVSVVRLVEGEKSPFTIARIESAHDDQGGRLRGKNTIHVLEAGGVRIAHLGDLGAPLTDEQIQKIGKLDALLIPVGGYYTIDAGQARAMADILSPTVTIPMHYRANRSEDDDVIAPIEAFTRLYDDEVRYLPGDTIVITKDMPRQIAVLQYK